MYPEGYAYPPVGQYKYPPGGYFIPAGPEYIGTQSAPWNNQVRRGPASALNVQRARAPTPAEQQRRIRISPVPSSSVSSVSRSSNEIITDYYKIGETVRVRKFHRDTSQHTLWVYGQVVRPVLHASPSGEERVYQVQYVDPTTSESKQKYFSPRCREIEPLFSEKQRNTSQPIVFARIEFQKTRHRNLPQEKSIWTPVAVLHHSPLGGVSVRVLLGPAKGNNVDALTELVPYNSVVAAALIKYGFMVEGDGNSV
ncbi:hypothetical protein C8J56DRAFT_881802 [Mycena floridula]|nr:hypothetical protein C8J56DRAFT_881802 [Mycena floridula]